MRIDNKNLMLKDEILNLFSLFLQYPDMEIKKLSLSELENFSKALSFNEKIKEIIKYFLYTDLQQLQEQYIKVFDIHPSNHLYAGYVILGEDLRRGILLQQLKHEYNNCQINIGNELPDFIPLLLKLLEKHKDQEFKNELIEYLILPALKALIKRLDNTIYEELLLCLEKYLKTLLVRSQVKITKQH